MRNGRISLVTALSVLVMQATAQQIDEPGVHLLAQKLRNAYAAKDVDGVMGLWSATSPQRAAAREATQKLLSNAASAELKASAAHPPEFEGERAWLRMDREIVASASGAGKAEAARKAILFECVKEDGEWKVQKEVPATDHLAGQLAKAASEKDQADLLSANQDLMGAELALAVVDRGREARNHGEMKQALRMQGLAASIADRTGAEQARALAFNNTGLVYYDQGDYAEALSWYQKSLALSERIHDDAGTARSLNNMGAVLMDCGDVSGAWENFQRSLALGEKIHSPRLISNANGNLAIIHGRRGDYLQALALFKKSYDMDQPSGNKRAIAIDLIDIGNVFLWQGDYAQSDDYFRKSMSVAESGGLKPLMAYALADLGRSAELRGDMADASEKYERSRAICEEVGDKVCAANALSFLGGIAAQRGEAAKAIDYFGRSLAAYEAAAGGQERSFTLAQLAAVHNKKGDYEQALKTAAEALRLSEGSGFREVVWRAHLETGKAYEGMHDAARAERELKESIGTIEEIRLNIAGPESEQETFFEDKLEPYHRMLGVLAAAGRNDEAFQIAERAKARVLVDVLKNGRAELASFLTEEERNRDRELRINLASVNARLMRAQHASPADAGAVQRLGSDLEQARLAYSAYETTLYAQHPQWKLQSGATEPITLEQALPLMQGADSAFVEFVIADDTLYTFVPAGKAVRVFKAAVSRDDLRERVDRFRRQLAERNLGFRASATALYKLLLGPAAGLLANKRELVIIPDGVLWELPFQALVNPAGQYLLDTTAVSYAPSLTALKAMIEAKGGRKRDAAKVQLLAMGNPAWGGQTEQRVKSIYRDQELGSLPLAETEVRRLANIYGQSHVYVGPEARESRFKSEAGEAQVLHLATHGILNNASPMYSYLLLAGEGESSVDDGLLEAQELLRMKLRAELAVLSACETARGRVGKGEGVIGLSWALFVAGVPSTVLSQWKVESDSTSRLMVAFHQNRRSGMSDAEALRRAALAVRKDAAYQHPFYWTPFILIGANH